MQIISLCGTAYLKKHLDLPPRFRVLKEPILQSYKNAIKTVLACVALHNYLREREPTDDVPFEVSKDTNTLQSDKNVMLM